MTKKPGLGAKAVLAWLGHHAGSLIGLLLGLGISGVLLYGMFVAGEATLDVLDTQQQLTRAQASLASRALLPLTGGPLPFYARELSSRLAATPLASCPPQAAPARGPQVDELNARAPGWRAVDARVIRPNPENVADYRRVRDLTRDLFKDVSPDRRRGSLDRQLARVEVALGCDLNAPFSPEERMGAYLRKLRALQD